MRTAHFGAFDAALKSLVPVNVYDGDAPLNSDGTVRHETYVVEHDMGFDTQSDGRLAAPDADASDGTYRVVVRIVGTARATVRGVADNVKAGMVGRTLTIAGRSCGPIQKDHGPDGMERDTTVSAPLFYLDLDFIWRSSRA